MGTKDTAAVGPSIGGFRDPFFPRRIPPHRDHRIGASSERFTFFWDFSIFFFNEIDEKFSFRIRIHVCKQESIILLQVPHPRGEQTWQGAPDVRIALEGTRLAKIRLEQGGDAHIQASTAFSAAQATWRSRRPLTERPASRRQESNEWQPRRLPCPNDRLDPRGHPKTGWHHAQQARSPSAVPWWFEMLTWGMRRR